jgi:hypothetical protein
MMNGDLIILILIIIEFTMHKGILTMCQGYEHRVPYGVIEWV